VTHKVTSMLCRDAAGRDFSVNSLAIDPVRMLMYDCNGGVRALRQFRVAAASIPIASLTSDPVRCVRYVAPRNHCSFVVTLSTPYTLQLPFFKRCSVSSAAKRGLHVERFPLCNCCGRSQQAEKRLYSNGRIHPNSGFECTHIRTNLYGFVYPYKWMFSFTHL
jgi:hypothetical protein